MTRGGTYWVDPRDDGGGAFHIAPRGGGGRGAAGNGGAGGFTLIELLLVIAILSAVAMAAFGLAAEDRGETRREDTMNRLVLLRRATLGIDAPAYGGEARVSGFVADNGRLPENVRELAENAKDPSSDMPRLSLKKPHYPVYDKDFVDAGGNCAQKSGAEIKKSSALLLKGYRGGGYLAGVARNGKFRDGWGNARASDDEENFGWIVEKNPTDNPTDISFTSYGLDNLKGPDDENATTSLAFDQSITIEKDEWKVSLAGWQVGIRNDTNETLFIGDDYSAALLVFENDETGGKWLRYTSTNTGSTCPNELEPRESCALVFDTEVECNGKVPAEIPIGQHLLLLLKGGKPYHDADDSNTTMFFSQAVFYPGVSRPAVTLDIR
ncbi:MAG: prepilin-type N-terminal cleavage/methylation domain-containing protein [Zoogloeaceae bacterium]|jgi:prepilin-type N-terminal cleavage/methylation domain-containing protein|nr:prepilin-type N-terminal cleavage/methylation domain-containing protein [Zoogloeaceae bacterium]